MRTIPFTIGMAAGMIVATAAVTAMYPDVSRRMLRDGRRAVRCTKRAACRFGNMFS